MKHIQILFAGFLAGAALVSGVASSSAAAPALRGRLELRALTPSNIKSYGLTNAQGASGLNTIGVGRPAYLEAEVNIAIPATDIVSVVWALTEHPIGSAAVLTNSPLGTNVPIYEPADRAYFRLADRSYLRPDMVGQYTVSATITTKSSGATNVSQTINASTYMGIDTCALCHSSDKSKAPEKVAEWQQTLHATMLTKAIDGLKSDHYSKNCISCHTVGYDTNSAATNGGFDDVAKQLGWTFPSVLTNGNWAAMPSKLTNLSNIQCENCHGAGSQHAYSLGDPDKISVSINSGNCSQCHDSAPTHVKTAEWNNSGHAMNPRTPSGAGRESCSRCHTGGGFANYLDTIGTTNSYIDSADTTYSAITCATCHDPHDATNPHQLRAGSDITLDDGTTVTNAGLGGFCMNCHQSRNGSVTNSIVKYPLGQKTWAGGSSFGVHDSPVADMFEGVNGWTYGQNIPSSAHRNSISNTCVTCHMQIVATNNPAFTKAGGHTWKMDYDVVSGGVTNTVDMVAVCAQCHGPIDSFDLVRGDYNGDGVIEGVQTEVQKLLNKLSTLLPPTNNMPGGNYVADGRVKTSISTRTNWQSKFLKAAYNWQFVNNDHSLGVHNVAYAVGLLKASISDLTGDSNNDGLPDAWQIQYFGSATSSNAAPNFSAAGDGVPNWMKYALGLDPTKPGTSVTNGVVWANGSNLFNPQDTNALVHIYTAAEVAFNTEVGKTYQIQSIASIGSGWVDVGGPITGTGETYSYVTPTRQNVKQFYRVVPKP